MSLCLCVFALNGSDDSNGRPSPSGTTFLATWAPTPPCRRGPAPVLRSVSGESIDPHVLDIVLVPPDSRNGGRADVKDLQSLRGGHRSHPTTLRVEQIPLRS